MKTQTANKIKINLYLIFIQILYCLHNSEYHCSQLDVNNNNCSSLLLLCLHPLHKQKLSLSNYTTYLYNEDLQTTITLFVASLSCNLYKCKHCCFIIIFYIFCLLVYHFLMLVLVVVFLFIILMLSNVKEMNEVAVVQQVVCWLIRLKASVRVPGQTSKRNRKSISSAISSQQISGKNSESQ